MKKYRIYIDEVGNPDLKNLENFDNRFLCLSGVVFNLDYTRTTFQPQLEILKTKYFDHHPDEPIIFHRKEIMFKKGAFNVLKDPDLEKSFNRDLLSFLQDWDFQVIGSIIDKKEFCDLYSSWRKDPYHYCLEVILERYRLLLKTREAIGDVMVEARGGNEDRLLKKDFKRMMEEGTAHLTPADLSQQITSKELKLKNKAANIAGLQLADLLAHSVRRFAFGEFWNITENKKTFSDEVIKILQTQQKFFSFEEKILDYGIKKLP